MKTLSQGRAKMTSHHTRVQRKLTVLVLAGLFLAAKPVSADWQYGRCTSPEACGFTTGGLNQALSSTQNATGGQTWAFLVIKDDKVVYEWYSPGYNGDSMMTSLGAGSKGLILGTAMARAESMGLLNFDNYVTSYTGALHTWTSSNNNKNLIRVRDLGQHTHGIDTNQCDNASWSGSWSGAANCSFAPLWSYDIWNIPNTGDVHNGFKAAFEVAPMVGTPGGDASHYTYGQGEVLIGSYVLAAATGQDLRTFFRNQVGNQLGLK
jgi:CubicO group peptidase (beta-lactamase class C family)